MKALVVTGPGETDVQETPDPHPEPGGVVLRVDTCGICGSDVHAVESGMARAGRILGHEFAGVIEAVGPGVAGWRVGQPVAVNPLGNCGECVRCRRGLPFWCSVPNIGLGAPGGMAQYAAVPQRQLVAIPDGMPVSLGARAEPLAVALNAVDQSGLKPEDTALVYGIGPIGLHVILALRAIGAGRIIAVGRAQGRREVAAAIGADVVLDARETDVPTYVAERELDITAAFECAGAAEPLTACLTSLGPGGVCVLVGLNPQPVPLPTMAMLRNGLKLVSSSAFPPATYERAVALLAGDKLDSETLISKRIPLARAPEVLVALRDPQSLVGVVVEPWI